MMGKSDHHLSQHTLALLPKRQQRELKLHLEKIVYLQALAEEVSNEHAASLRRFATTLGDAIDELERRVAPLDRLTEAQRKELESQIDSVLATNRHLLDQAQAYAFHVIEAVMLEPTTGPSSQLEEFMVGLSGSKNNWTAIRKALGR